MSKKEMTKKPMSMGHHMSGNMEALKIVAWITGVYFIVELGLGIYSGSIAVLSDAFHTFSAVGGVVLALVASKIAQKPANRHKTFGSVRSEIIGALLNGFFLLIMAIIVFYMGYKRFLNPIELPVLYMLIAAAGGLITEAFAIKILYGRSKDNLNMKGAFWHILQTFVGSLIIIIAAVVIWLTGYQRIDPILGMVFGLVLLYASYGIIRDSFSILLESVPKGINVNKIKKSLESIRGVKNAHHIHAWSLTTGKNIFSTHLQIVTFSDSERILTKAHKILKSEYKFYFSTVQLEIKCTDSGDAKDIDITGKVK